MKLHFILAVGLFGQVLLGSPLDGYWEGIWELSGLAPHYKTVLNIQGDSFSSHLVLGMHNGSHRKYSFKVLDENRIELTTAQGGKRIVRYERKGENEFETKFWGNGAPIVYRRIDQLPPMKTGLHGIPKIAPIRYRFTCGDLVKRGELVATFFPNYYEVTYSKFTDFPMVFDETPSNPVCAEAISAYVGTYLQKEDAEKVESYNATITLLNMPSHINLGMSKVFALDGGSYSFESTYQGTQIGFSFEIEQ